MANAPNLLLSHHLLGNPLLQYQLLLNSLLLPMVAPPEQFDGTVPESTSVPDDGANVDMDDYLRMTALSNQLAITQLNQLVAQLAESDTGANCKDNKKGEQREQEAAQQREYQRKLLQLISEGFKALSKELGHTKTQVASGFNLTATGQESSKSMLLQALLEGFNNSNLDVADLRRQVESLSVSFNIELQDLLETLKDETTQLFKNHTHLVTELSSGVQDRVLEGFSNSSVEVATLRQQHQDLSDSHTTTMQELQETLLEEVAKMLKNHTVLIKGTLELAQVTATGLLKLQADYHNMTDILSDFITNFDNFTATFPAMIPTSQKCEKNDSAVVAECPNQFFLVEEECFFFSGEEEQLTWAQARKFCRNVGGDLAEPHDPLVFILALRSRFGEEADELWVGGEEKQEVSTPDTSFRSDTGVPLQEESALWHWLSGAVVDHGWHKGRPSGPVGIESCLTVSKLSLNSAYCGKELRFVCEYPRNP
ncbi:uncharacterized protein [Cherax quadricarinatus]|uniref:uncharacterized protein isoform X3 n=1 Tax=Cherax quadricarinatus TaxID=27406 RepID=UPI002379A8E4|nr:uncharacterized protein LOC128693348 isoform X3 [Cherax quadricarinatus]